MIELLTFINLWCQPYPDVTICRKELLACVVEGRKPADSVERLEFKLLECLVKK